MSSRIVWLLLYEKKQRGTMLLPRPITCIPTRSVNKQKRRRWSAITTGTNPHHGRTWESLIYIYIHVISRCICCCCCCCWPPQRKIKKKCEIKKSILDLSIYNIPSSIYYCNTQISIMCPEEFQIFFFFFHWREIDI
jgi:hypothetical protein